MAKEKLRATPAARFYARNNDIDLANIKGSGSNGRIHKSDVVEQKGNVKLNISPVAKRIAEIENINLAELQGLQGSGPRGKIMKADVLRLMSGDSPKAESSIASAESQTSANIAGKKDQEVEVVPMTAMRTVIAKRMSESFYTAPTFQLSAEVDMTNLLAFRKQVGETILEDTGVKASVTDFLAFAITKALMKHPYVNASLSEDGKNIYLHKFVNMAIAVGTDTGLLVPVVENADKMTLKEMVVANKNMINKTLENKLSPDEMTGSTFTISNLGMYGIDSFTAIINQPNSGILAISSTKKKPVVVNDEIVIRPMMTLTLTVDHRVVDGLEGAKFMQSLKKGIENPLTLLI